MKSIPASIARRIMPTVSARSVLPHPPKFMVPSAVSLTDIPVAPRYLRCITVLPRSSWSRSPGHLECLQAVDGVEDAELGLLVRVVHRQGGKTPKQRRERDAHLHACQRRPEAVVHPVAEGGVARRSPGDVERVG